MNHRLRIGALDDLPNGQGRCFEDGDLRVAVFRFDDAVYAIGDRCSHAEASLAEGEVFDLEVECPRHGSEFDLRTGQPATLPATQPVPVYQVSVEDGDVFVTVGSDGDSGGPQ